MTDQCPLPAWDPHVECLRAVGLDACCTTVSPGWWFIRIDLPNGDAIFLGSPDAGDDSDLATLDMNGGPGPRYLAYREHPIDGGLHAIQSETVWSNGNGMHDLLFAVAGAIYAPLKDYQAW